MRPGRQRTNSRIVQALTANLWPEEEEEEEGEKNNLGVRGGGRTKKTYDRGGGPQISQICLTFRGNTL